MLIALGQRAHNPQHPYAPTALAGGAKFWFHAMCNCFITVAERDLMLLRSPTKRLVSHARPGDVTEGYAADWTVELRYRGAEGSQAAHRLGRRRGGQSRPGWCST